MIILDLAHEAKALRVARKLAAAPRVTFVVRDGDGVEMATVLPDLDTNRRNKRN